MVGELSPHLLTCRPAESGSLGMRVHADVVRVVMSFLDGASLARCEIASKRIRDEANDKFMWRRALSADFMLSRVSR